jgi:hypothetical protein
MASKVRVYENSTFEVVSEPGHDLARLWLRWIVRWCAIDCQPTDLRSPGAGAHAHPDARARANPIADTGSVTVADANSDAGSVAVTDANPDAHAGRGIHRQQRDAPVDLHRQ